VCAICELEPELPDQGAPPHWRPYFATADAEAAAQRAAELGGTVIAPPRDAADQGRMALLRDPAGALLSLWQPRADVRAHRFGEPGALCWSELLTADVDAAARFYAALFGWEARREEAPGGASVTVLWSGKRRTASMMPMQKEWGDVPPCWMVYFAVADCDATAARAAQAGGRVIVEPLSIPTAGRLALLVDPGGALFGALQLGAPAK
jgi:hypothetical protein